MIKFCCSYELASRKVSPSKFAFFQTSVKFLGHIISEKGIETNPEKVKCIQNWPKPLLQEICTKFFENHLSVGSGIK